MPNLLSRRNVLTSTALSAGAVALLKGGLTPVPASVQNALPSATVQSFSKNGVRFHTYVLGRLGTYRSPRFQRFAKT